MTNKIKSWSYSRYATYKQCPQKAKFKYIDKLDDPSGPAAERGTEIHLKLQKYIEGKSNRMPVECHPKHVDTIKLLRRKHAVCEGEWAFTDKWNVTGWFSPEAWLRVKIDALYIDKAVAHVFDHKTGKFRPGQYDEQLLQYCMATLLMYPDVVTVESTLLFHDTGDIVKKTLHRAYLDKVKAKVLESVEAMLSDTRFAPCPGVLCGWCSFSKKKGGPCKMA